MKFSNCKEEIYAATDWFDGVEKHDCTNHTLDSHVVELTGYASRGSRKGASGFILKTHNNTNYTFGVVEGIP